MALFFHANYGLSRPRMAGVLRAAVKEPLLKDTALSKPFGYKGSFSAKYRSWLHVSGISELGLPLELTDMGKVVYDNDAPLKTDITKWFMHHELGRLEKRAQAWHYFIKKFLPGRRKFTRSDLLKGIMGRLRRHSEEHFGPGSTMNPVIVRKILQCYTLPDALGGLGIIKEAAKGQFEVGNPDQLGPWLDASKLEKAYDTR